MSKRRIVSVNSVWMDYATQTLHQVL